MSRKFYVSWENLHREARRLSRRQLPASQWKGILAVSRGGLVPAAIMARELGIRFVDTICISSYEHDNQSDLNVLKRIDGDGEGFRSLMIWLIWQHSAPVTRNALQKQNWSLYLPSRKVNIWLMTSEVAIPQDTWIEQPWDMVHCFVPPICEENQ